MFANFFRKKCTIEKATVGNQASKNLKVRSFWQNVKKYEIKMNTYRNKRNMK